MPVAGQSHHRPSKTTTTTTTGYNDGPSSGVAGLSVDPAYFVLSPVSAAMAKSASAAAAAAAAGTVSVRRVQASGGLVAHVGRNGQPTATATAKVDETATATAKGGLLASRPHLCWATALADAEAVSGL